MTTKSIRLSINKETEDKAKELYKRLYPRHKYDLAILLEELIDNAEKVKSKLTELENLLHTTEEQFDNIMPIAN